MRRNGFISMQSAYSGQSTNIDVQKRLMSSLDRFIFITKNSYCYCIMFAICDACRLSEVWFVS